MKNVLAFLLLIVVVLGFISPKYGFYRHVIADGIAYQAGEIRGENPFTKVAVKVIQVTNNSPYLLPSQFVQSTDPKIVQLAKNITKGKTTDTEKSQAIYDWVTHHITYDFAEYQRWEADSNFTYENALETLNNGTGICMGYARLNAALHRATGIEAKVVYGEEHAWNRVKLNGQWQDQDTTYGAGYIDVNTHQFVQAYNSIYFAYTDKHLKGEFMW